MTQRGSRISDLQFHFFSDRQDVTHPRILNEIFYIGTGFHYDVGAKPAGLEPTLRIKRAETFQSGGRQKMHRRIIEESANGRVTGDSFVCNNWLAHIPTRSHVPLWSVLLERGMGRRLCH